MSEELPEGWITTELGAVADVALGKMLDRAKRTKGRPLSYLRNANVRWHEFNLEDLLTMPFEEHELERFGLALGDVLICEGGEPGRAAVWAGTEQPLMFQKALLRARSRGAFEPQWLAYALQHSASKGELERYFTGSTIKHFPLEAANKYSLPLAPIEEQKRVLAKVRKLTGPLTKANARLDRVARLLKRFRITVLNYAFSGDTSSEWRELHPGLSSPVLPEIAEKKRKGRRGANMSAADALLVDDQLPELPDSWQYARLDRLVEQDTVITYGIVLPGPEIEGGIPYVRQQDIEDGRIRTDDLRHTTPEIANKHPRSALKPGDVLLCIIRNLRVAVVPAGLEGANITQGAVRIRPDNRLVLTEYLFRYLQSPHAQAWMQRRYFGMDMPRINVEDARAIPVPLPPLEEQAFIVARLRSVLSLADTIERRVAAALAKAEKLPQAILAKAFSGELVPTEAELARAEGRPYESAEALLHRLAPSADSPASKRPRKKKPG